MEIKLDLDNKEEAAKQLVIIQQQFDELLTVMKEQEKQLKENVIAMENLTTTSVDLSDTIKNINIVLGSKKDLWAGDEVMNDLMNKLAHFVMSSGAIKLGVISNAK